MQDATPVVADPAMSPAETGSVSGLAAQADKSSAKEHAHDDRSHAAASTAADAVASATPIAADPAMSPAESGSVSGLAALADKRGSHDHDREAGAASTTSTSAAAAAAGPPAAVGAGATGSSTRAGAAAPSTRQALAEESSDEDDDAKRLQFKVIVLGDGTVGKTSLLHRFAFSSFERSYKQTVGVDFFSREVALPTRSSAPSAAAASGTGGAEGKAAGSAAATGGGSGGGTSGGSTTAVLSVWDIGGQNAGSKMLRPYIAGAHAVLLAYDITNADSFYHLEDWLEDVRASFPDAGTVPAPSAAASSTSGSLSSRNRGATYAAAAGGAGSGGAARSRRRGPLLGVVGNKTDEAYLRAIKPAQHRDLCDRLGAHCFLVSAKTGDGVAQMFFRVAAELAGIDVTRGEVAASGGPIPATIVAYANGEDDGAGASGSGSGSGSAVPGAAVPPAGGEEHGASAGDGGAAAATANGAAVPPAGPAAGRRRGGKGDRDREGKCTVQ